MNRLRAFAAVVVVAASPLLAQPPAPEQAPVFRSGVDLVRLDIRVTDDDGRPIADLRPDEIRIREEGAARPVVLFQHVAAPRTTYAEAAARTIAGQVSTNQGSPRGHVYVFVFDEAHIRSGHEQRARAAADRFLRTRIRPGDRVALYSLPGPGAQVEFTADVARVLRALASVRGVADDVGIGAGMGAPGAMRVHEAYEIARGHQEILERLATAAAASRAPTDTRTTSNRPTRDIDQEDDRAGVRRVLIEDARAVTSRADGETRRFLVALADVIRTLRAVDGRKAIVLFSEGFEVDNVTHELEGVAAAAALSQSVVYAMDLNARTSDASEEVPRGGEPMTEVRDRLQSLSILTGDTGGTLVIDASPQLDLALARIADTTEDYYIVGFTPDGGESGGYRRVHVDVTRPGAHVNTRTGYAPNGAASLANRRQAIDAALRAPFPKQDLGLEYTTYALRGAAPDVLRIIVSLAAELPVASANAGPADVVYVVRQIETGKVAASGSDHMPLPSAPQHAGATTGTGLYRVQFELPPGTYLMRAVVREPGGLLGSADRRFRVQALGGPDISASDLVIGSADVAGLPVRAVAYASEMVTGVFELYARTAAQLDTLTTSVELVPLAGGSTALSSYAELQPVRSTDAGVSRPGRLELPLAAVPPREYLVRATVRNGRETITELLRDVSVRPGTRPAAAAPVAEPAPFDPADVLHGEVARRFVSAIEARAAGTSLEAAARAAARGDWANVDSALAAARSTTVEASALRGLAAFARGRYETAAAAFRDAQSGGARDDAALMFILGWAHAASGDAPAAVTAWRNAIVGDPTHVPSYLALVDTYSKLGHPELALQVVNSGLRVLPDSPELIDRLALLEKR
jgi:VWFA-related protein